jgi:excisionase family DNA binding protein
MESRKHEYATSEVAKMVGVDKRTLYRWLYDQRLPEPRQIKVGRVKFRIWTDIDVQRALELRQEMRRGRPLQNEEVKIDRRLLDVHAQLKWYSHAIVLSGKERKALTVLQNGLSERLVKEGLKW